MQSTPPDCFAEFDAAFAAISAELETTRHALERPAPPLQLLPPIASDPDADRESAETGEPALRHASDLEEYEEAFNRIDALMDRAGQAAAISAHALPSRAAQAVGDSPSVAPIAESRLWRPKSEGSTPLERLLGTFENLWVLRVALDSAGERTIAGLSNDVFARVLAEARDVCDEFGLKTARVRVDFALDALNRPQSDLRADLGELARHMLHDSQTCLLIPTIAAAPPTPLRSPRSTRKRSPGVAELREVAADAEERP